MKLRLCVLLLAAVVAVGCGSTSGDTSGQPSFGSTSTTRVLPSPDPVIVTLVEGQIPTPVTLRVYQQLEVNVDPTELHWVGGNEQFAPTLETNDSCDTTCSLPRRTFTAAVPGQANIWTVVTCRPGAMCALGPALTVTAAAA